MGFLQQNDRQCENLTQPQINPFLATFQLYELVCNMHLALNFSLDPSRTWECLQKGGRGTQSSNMLCARIGGWFDTTNGKDMLLWINKTLFSQM